jgi:beta-galactosidase
VYATITDKEGTQITNYNQVVDFSMKGNAIIEGPKSIAAEAGIAIILIKAGVKPGNIEITGKTGNLVSAMLKIKSK